MVAVVVLTGLGAVLVVERQAADDARDRQDVLATEAAVLIDGTVTASMTSVAGAGGLVGRRGEVDVESFRAYARDVVDASPITALAYEPVVTAAERQAFEAGLGRPILELEESVLVPAGDRPIYYPVQAVEPTTERTTAVLGFDILSDPVRGTAAIAARDSGRTILTEPVRATGEGSLSYFLVKPLYRGGAPVETVAERRAAHAGFLTTVYAGSGFAELIADSLPGGSRFTLHDGDERLAGTSQPPRNGTLRSVDVGDRTWTLVLEDGRRAERTLLLSVAAFATLLVVGLLVIFRRSTRHEADLERTAAVIGRTADVAQALAAAGSVEEVELVIRHQLPRVLGAKGASLGVVDRDTGVLRLGSSPAIDPAVTGRWTEVPLDAAVPIAEVVRTGQPLLLRTVDDWRAHGGPEVVEDVLEAGLVSAACLPLKDRHGQVAATLAMSWGEEVAFDATVVDTLRTITELCEYTLDRARSTDQAAQAARQLAHLASRLASAISIAEVLDIITESGSSPVDAAATSVGLIDHEAGVLRTHHGRSVSEDVRRRFTDPPLDAPLAFTDAARTGLMVLLGDYDAFTERYPESASATSSLGFGARAALPMRDSEGNVVGAIVHAWGGPRVFHETLVSTLLTVADMAAQALERAGQSEAEHRLVTTLQDSLLVPLPPSEHLDISARYLPSVADIGMGGDWYEGIAIDDHRYALILGDVAGHGITAVGDMAQLRAVVGALVRLGIPLRDVFTQATALLQAADHTPTASSLLVVIDTERGHLSYAAAGHPPPFVRDPDGDVVRLEAGRQPILGIAVEDHSTADHPFPPGSVLVAYTDGLIERRGEPIDQSIDRLGEHVGGAPDGSNAIADHLLRECLGSREPADDVALVVISHRG